MQKRFVFPDRSVLRVRGADHRRFLQDLVTNDLEGLAEGVVYAALLSPQGKYLFDFFLVPDGDAILIDVAEDRARALAQRLSLYKLRADVVIEGTELEVAQVWSDDLSGLDAYRDPRDAALGWRVYGKDLVARLSGCEAVSRADWDALRVARMIPEAGVELLPDESYILEAGFERLSGVDFRKGCYVGQEVTARMKHKTELKKGLAKVSVEGPAPPPGTEILSDGKPVGKLFTVAGDAGLAHLRFDRAKADMRAGEATLRRVPMDETV